MYNLKNRNKGVKIGLITAFFALLIGCLIAFVSNPFSVAKTANADAQTPEYNEVSAQSDEESEDYGISAQSALSLAAAWNSAVQESIDGNGKQVTFTLTEDWTAPASGSFTSFGTGVGFHSGGAIYVPERAYILLDLNGHTLNRNLNNFATDGNVIKVSGGLELENRASAKAFIRGGYDANGAGGGISVDGGTVFMADNIAITDNVALDLGGGVYVNSGGEFTMDGGEISNNLASYGGGINVETGTLYLYGGTICNNNAYSTGGGVWFSDGRLEINGTKISNNTTQTSTGAINDSGLGGGVYVWENTTMIMTAGEISGNVSSLGGGIHIAGAKFTMSGGVISNNTATGNQYSDGGGVFVDYGVHGDGTIFTMNGGTISGNTAIYDGGGVYTCDDTTFILTNGTISGNSANHEGGGVFLGICGVEGDNIVSGGIISGNSAICGGGIFFYDCSTSVLSGGTFSNNVAEVVGEDISIAIYDSMWTTYISLVIAHPDIKFGACLYAQWTADSATHSFGTGTGFFSGAIHVPAGLNIKLDLNGHSINRKLSSAISNGQVFRVEGTLEIFDGSSSGNGAISGGDSSSFGGGLYIDNGGTLILNGGNISDNKYGSGVHINNGGTFIMNGGVISRNSSPNSSGYGGAAVCNDGGTFIMNGGEISENTVSGYYSATVWSCGRVEMNGGLISNNSLTGVFVYRNEFIMNGGQISDNTNSSGVELRDNGTFTMNGGTISGNSEAGVSTSGGTFIMSGGKISGNSSNGVTVSRDDSFLLSGSANITGNVSSSGTASNVYLYNGAVITINGKLTSARIGVTLQSTTGVFTSRYLASGNSNRQQYYEAYFFSDAGHSLSLSNEEISITSSTAPTKVDLKWQYRIEGGNWTDVSGNDITFEYSGISYYVRALPPTGSISLDNNTPARNGGTYSYVVTYNSSTFNNPSFTLTITPKTVDIGWSDETLRYNGSIQYPQPIISGLIYGDKVSVNLNTSSAGKNAGTGYSVTATGFSGENASNYRIASGITYSTTYSILRAQLAVPAATGSNEFAYNGEEHTFTVPTVAGMSLSNNKATNAGEYNAVLSLDTSNYEWLDGTTASVNYPFSVLAKHIFVGGISVANKEYDGTTAATVDISTAKLSGVLAADLGKLGLVFSAGSEFDGASVGMHYVVVNGIELKNLTEEDIASNYILDFDEVTRYAQIYPATVTVSGVVANDKEYDGTTAVTFDVSGATVTGALSGELDDVIANLIVNGYFNSKNAGTGVGVTVTGYRLGGQYAGNYIVDFENSENTLTADISKAQVEVTLGKTEYTVTYGNGLKITFSQNSPVKSESVNLALEYYDEHGNSKLSGEPADAGKYVVKVVVDPADPNLGNYTVKTTGEGLISEATVIIEKASLTVTVEDLEIEYGDDKPADGDYTLLYNGWLNGDKAAFEAGTITFTTPITVSTDYVQGNAAGKYAIILADGELKNYEITYVNGTLNVLAKKVTVVIDDKSSEYGDSDVELTSNGTDDMQITLTRAAGAAVGKYAITGTSANANYDVTFLDGVYEITKARLTVTANGAGITYGEVAKSDGATYAGFKNGEDEGVLSGNLAFRFTYTQYGDIFEADGVTAINYYIIPYGVTADNYEIEFVNGLLTVNKKSATVTVSNAASDITSVPADRAEAAEKIKCAVTGTVNGDDLQMLLAIAENGMNGVYSVTWPAVGVYSVTGSSANTNYAVTFVYEGGAANGTYTVSQGTLIITANTLILGYGDNIVFSADIDEAVTAEGLPTGSTLKGLIDSGVISGSLTVLAFGDPEYGNYTAMGSAYRVGDDIFDANGNRISYIVIPTGLSSSSYNIVFKPGKLMVEPKSIIVTLDNKSSVYGETDKDLTASVEAGTLINYDGTDSVTDFLGITDLMRAAGADAGNYAITATGATNRNYRVTFVNGVYTITQYEVEVKWISGNADDKDFTYTYNAKEQAPVATFEMPDGTVFKSTDLTDKNIEITGSGVNAGNYKAQAFLLNPNLKFKSGTDTAFGFTIDKKQLGVTWYANADDVGDVSKAITGNTESNPVRYDYHVRRPYAPVVALDGIEASDVSDNFYYISGEQSEVNITATPYEAVLHILNANYDVAKGDRSVFFVIVKSAPGGFAWYDKIDGTQISSLKEYEYNGEVQHPVAKALGNEEFVYTIFDITDGGERKVTSTIGVGNYKIVATPVNGNLELSADAATFYFDIVAMDVTSSLTWSATSFEYNGSEQVPTAYYVDAQGQKVNLTVNGDRGVNANEDGSVYNISVTLDTRNYKFVVNGEDTQTFETTYTITAKEITVTWTSKYTDEDGNFKWEMVYSNSDESESIIPQASMINEVENVGLAMKVWYQASENDAPVLVNSIKNAGIYTLCVELADKTPNYTITDAEQTFRIGKRSLTLSAEDKEVNTGDKAPVLTATFGGDGFAEGEDAESLGLTDANGGMNWLATNYKSTSPYIAESEYTKDEDINNLKTLADLNGYKGYFIVLTDSEEKLKALNALLSNYDWSFEYGRMIIIAVEGDVSIVLTQAYNGENQIPAAKYRVGDAWLDLKVEVYTDDTYSTKVENPELKDVGEYYILLKKYAEDNVPLEGADENGNVKKVFTITKREIKVNISDKTVVYGEVTETNFANYLATLWAYASSDALYRPLAGDDLEITLNVNFGYDAAGFAVVKKDGDKVTGYEITGAWSEDATLRNNYNVVFAGTNGDKGAFTVTNARITYTETLTDGFNQILETDKANGNYLLGLYNRVDGKYEHISIAGNPDATVHIFYSNIYDRSVYELTDNLPQDEAVWKELPLCNIPVTADGSYYYNFKIVVDNHETYYGQWTVEVIAGKAYIRIIFSTDKRFETTYGDGLLTGSELAVKLYEEGYVSCLDLTEEMFLENILNGNLTAKVLSDGALNKGEYTIVFEGIEKLNPDWIITYKQDVNASDSTATNLNMYVVNRRNITLTWDETSFNYDGKAHMPTPGIAGWNMTGSTVNGNETVYTFVNAENGAELSLKVTTNGGDFTTVGSENIVIAEIEDNNYALDSFNATRAVSIINGDIGGGEPAAEGGVPVAAIIALAVCLGLAVMLILILAVVLKNRKTAAYADEDGFNEIAGEDD